MVVLKFALQEKKEHIFQTEKEKPQLKESVWNAFLREGGYLKNKPRSQWLEAIAQASRDYATSEKKGQKLKKAIKEKPDRSAVVQFKKPHAEDAEIAENTA